MKINGIRRAPRYSPNSEARDRAIFAAVALALEERGHLVATYDEDALPQTLSADAVFSMARSTAALQRLSEAEAGGLRAVNPASSLLRWDRSALTELFNREQMPQPRSFVVSRSELTSGAALFPNIGSQPLRFPLWVKRGDACAQSPGDVVRVGRGVSGSQEADLLDLRHALSTLFAAGCPRIVVSEHAEGDLLKFYGVLGTDFFYLSHPHSDVPFSKFGLERYNAAFHDYSFDTAALRTHALRAASLTGIAVFGGDAIVTPAGDCLIIDFNDWPSFSPCRNAAAQAIARLIDK